MIDMDKLFTITRKEFVDIRQAEETTNELWVRQVEWLMVMAWDDDARTKVFVKTDNSRCVVERDGMGVEITSYLLSKGYSK